MIGIFKTKSCYKIVNWLSYTVCELCVFCALVRGKKYIYVYILNEDIDNEDNFGYIKYKFIQWNYYLVLIPLSFLWNKVEVKGFPR